MKIRKLPDFFELPLTPEKLRLHFKAAGTALKNLPGNDLAKLSNMPAIWPDAKPEWSAYGAVEATYRKLPPTREDLTRLDKVLDFAMILHDATFQQEHDLPEKPHQVIWARALGVSWRGVSRMRRRVCVSANSHETLRKQEQTIVAALVNYANGQKIFMAA